MNASKTIEFTFENTGSEDLTIVLGTQGGLVGYELVLEQENQEINIEVKNIALARTVFEW